MITTRGMPAPLPAHHRRVTILPALGILPPTVRDDYGLWVGPGTFCITKSPSKGGAAGDGAVLEQV
jgi:hypothetical protein